MKKTLIMSVISPLKSKHIQILLGAFFSFAVMIFHVRSIAKLGTYWDHQMDDGMAFLNLEWLKNGISIEDETFQLLTPYGYMVTYLMWIPLRVYFSLFSNSEFTIPALETSNILVYRNVFVFGILLIGLYALAVWSQLLIKVSKWFSVALMSMLFPTLAGYGMMNPKDIPVFTGVSCALALSFTSLSNSSVKDKFKNYLWVNCAIFFVLGVRPGAAYLLIVIFSFQTWQAKDRATFFKILLSGIPSLLICYYFSATARNFGILWLWETIQSSSNYTAWQGTMLLWGTPFETPISRLYQIGVLASQIPLFAVIFLLFALFLQIKRNSFRIRMNFETVRATHKILKSPIFLPSLLLVGIIVYIIIFSPMLYDDSRQTLFIWAFLIPTTLLAVKYVLENFHFRIMSIALVLLTALPLIDSVNLAPYSYVYRNEIANTLKPQGFETDFWGLSGRESSDWINANNPSGLKVRNNPNVVFQPFIPTYLINVSDPLPKSFYYQQIRRPFGVPEIFTECDLVHTVSRSQLFGGEKVMSWIRTCEDMPK